MCTSEGRQPITRRNVEDGYYVLSLTVFAKFTQEY